MVELSEFIVPLASVGFIYFAFRWGVSTFKKATKVSAVEQVLQQLGLRNFKVQDLNADKLDDKGFQRFIVLLQELKKKPLGTGTGDLGNLMELLGNLRGSRTVEKPSEGLKGEP